MVHCFDCREYSILILCGVQDAVGEVPGAPLAPGVAVAAVRRVEEQALGGGEAPREVSVALDAVGGAIEVEDADVAPRVVVAVVVVEEDVEEASASIRTSMPCNYRPQFACVSILALTLTPLFPLLRSPASL
jgi:hypothetical protein